MIRILHLSLYFCLIFFFASKLQAQDFITTFGTSGKLLFDFNKPHMSIAASAMASGGKILIGGSISDPKGSRKFKTYIARLSASGQIDESFGTKGYIYLDLGYDYENIKKILVLPNGKIMIGQEYMNIRETMAIHRLNEDGTLDKSFAQRGWLSYPSGFGDFDVYPDGSLLFAPSLPTTARFKLIKASVNGMIDPNYPTNFFAANEMRPKFLKILPDGRLLLGGIYNYHLYTTSPRSFVGISLANGTNDQNFGTDGLTNIETSTVFNAFDMKVMVKNNGDIDVLTGNPASLLLVHLDANGVMRKELNEGKPKLIQSRTTDFIPTDLRFDSQANIMIAGTTKDSEGTYQFGARRILSNGDFDQDFGISGYLEVETQLLRHEAPIISILPDQKILLMGSELGLNINSLSIDRFHSNGKIDRSFGNNGRVVTAPMAGINLSCEVLQDIIRLKDGKLMAAGFLKSSTSKSLNDNSLILVKIDDSGKPDPSFAKDGVALLHTGGENAYYYGFYHDTPNLGLHLAEDKSGGLFILASDRDHFLSKRIAVLYRITPSGQLDLTFGKNGKVDISLKGAYGEDHQRATGLVIQPDGKIVVGIMLDEQRMLRFKTNGELDLSFGKKGMVTELLLPAYSYSDSQFNLSKKLALFPDGKLVLVGKTNNSFYGTFGASKYHIDGTPDQTFGTNGHVSFRMTPNSNEDKPLAVLVQSDSKILIAGTGENGICLARLFSDGKFDPDFGTAGKMTGVYYSKEINGLALQSDGKILILGGSVYKEYSALENSSIHVIRTYPNGQPDPDFGSAGTIRFQHPDPNVRNHDTPGGLLATSTGEIYISGATDVGWHDRSNEPKSLVMALRYQEDDYQPKITSFSPKVATSDELVTLTGSTFLDVQSVSFGGRPAKSFKVVGPGKIEAVLSNGATGKIAVTTAKGTTEIDGFTYIERPTLNHTGIVYILKGIPLQLRTQAQSGLTYQWYKNNLAITGANTLAYEATETGLYKVTVSLGQVQLSSELVNINAKFHLPSDNFSLAATSVTCNGQQNGEISLTAKENMNYLVKVRGANYSKDFTMNTALTVSGLAAGNYNICISAENVDNFEQCFDLVITEPKNLSVYTAINRDQGTITLQLGGADNFHILFNNKNYETASTSIILPLATGTNTLSVSTALACRGSYSRTIDYRKTVIYPNPFSTHFSIITHQSWGEKLNIKLTDARGSKVYEAIYPNTNGELTVRNLEKLPAGLYILTIKSTLTNQTYKLVKP